jgi:hypothetical protein
MSQRTYSENEIAEIIRRAAEMESGRLREKGPSGDLPGLNIDELSEIASEAGLDPENVRQAARLLDSPAVNQPAETSQNEIFSEKWVNGELTEELADLLITDLNHRYNVSHKRQSWRDNILDDGPDETIGKSNVQRTGKSIEWKTLEENEAVEVRALIQPVKDKVRVRVSKKIVSGTGEAQTDRELTGYMAYIPYLAALVVLFSLPYSFLVNLIVAIVAFTLLQLTVVPVTKKVTQSIKKSRSANREKRSERYKRDVEQLSDELIALIGGSPGEAAKSGRIEIPDSDSRGQGSRGKVHGSRGREQGTGSK